MSRSPILFRCDATPEQGWEPFYQCMTLAQAIQRRRRGTYFFSRLEPNHLALTAHRGGHEWVAAEHPVGTSDDLDATLAQARKLNAAAIVVVASGLSVEYLRELNASGLVVVTVGPETSLDYPNRLVFNPFLGNSTDQYRHATGTQLLVGPRFALIRGMVRRVRPLRAAEPAGPFRAMLALGDDDLPGRSVELAKELLDMPKVDKLSVVARPHHPRLDELRAVIAEESGRAEIICENAEVSTRLTRAHFAITTGCSWSVELACLGMPQLIMTECDRYEANAQRLDEEGAAQYLGRANKVTSGQLRNAVQDLLLDSHERKAMTRIGRQLIDGRGTDRFVNGTEILLHANQRQSLVEERMAA
ncbi:MAG: polysaccharide biosynthesis protein [Gemmataceae bacterium]|nr:polysaccharide biosynthesis protein [Gemmataceae bacterium]